MKNPVDVIWFHKASGKVAEYDAEKIGSLESDAEKQSYRDYWKSRDSATERVFDNPVLAELSKFRERVMNTSSSVRLKMMWGL